MNESDPLPCCNIFIVDDDEQQARLMQEMAKTAQLATTVFTSSIKFLATTITQYDIIVLDLQMPEKDGIEIMRELAAQNIKPNFILVSGFDQRVLHSAKQLAESKQLNVISTLSKPIKARTFISLLTESYNQYKIDCQQKDSTNDNPDITSDITTETTNAITIEDLKYAIRKHQLFVHFQPQICFKTKQLKSAEILVRWQHPTLGVVLPDQFIPLAEKHMLMNLLTEEILKISIREYHKLSEYDPTIKVCINLSPQNINDLSMPEKLEALVKSNNIDPDKIILEVTESALMNGISDSLDILNRLRMKGFSLSIDHFGTGYSSLVKLYQAPLSELKIDQHFIMKILSDHDAAAIIKICILLAKELKMHTVAVGVETEEIWNQLNKMGCDFAQGFFIAKPMGVEEFIDWVKNWNLEQHQ